MWQRFTKRARMVVFFAQEEAQAFGEGFVSTEHLLLGLLREENTARTVIEHLGVSAATIQMEVEKQLPRGEERHSRDMTLTPRAKRVIDLAFSNAKNLDDNHIGTEHLLLGLIEEGDGLAGRVLVKLGLTLKAARAVTLSVQQNPTKNPSIAKERPWDFLKGSCLRTHMIVTMIANPNDRAGRLISAQCENLGALQWALWTQIARESLAQSNRNEKFLERVLRRAQEEANGELFGSEHLLLALFAEGDTAYRDILNSHGVTEAGTRDLMSRGSDS